MRRRSLRDARCLVTGASSGIGRSISERLAREGARVVLTGRSADRLEGVIAGLVAEGVSPERLAAYPADLTVASDRTGLLAAVARQYGGALDLIVNSAGVGAYGRFESHDESVLRRILEINVISPAEMCRAALPLLRRGEQPALINIGSIVARRALPGRSEYSASKHAVAGLTDALRSEWRIEGIHVLLVNPGFTATSFERNVLIDTAVYKTAHRRTMTPEVVAEAALLALQRGRSEVTLSPSGRLLLACQRLMPRFVNWGLGRWAARLYSDRSALARAEARPPADSGRDASVPPSSDAISPDFSRPDPERMRSAEPGR